MHQEHERASGWPSRTASSVQRRRRRARRFGGVVGAVLAASALVAACTPTGPGNPLPSYQPHVVVNDVDEQGRGLLEVDGCTLLDTDSAFTQRIDHLPAATFAPGEDPIEHGRQLLDAVDRNGLGPGASRGIYQNSVFGFPLNTVAGTKRPVTIGTFDYGVDTLDVFLPASDANVHWEGEPNAFDFDRHLLVLDSISCELQEHISYAHPLKTSEEAVSWQTPIRTDGTGVRPSRPVAFVEAAGLPIAPLSWRFDEVFPNGVNGPVGEIHHALRIALPKDVNSLTEAVWPAVRTDGIGTHPASVPMGTRLRLSAEALDRLSDQVHPGTRAVLQALHRYGAVVGDSTLPTTAASPGGFGLSGEFNPAWPDAVLAGIRQVRFEDFEVVDLSCWEGPTRLTVADPLPAAC